MKTDWVKCPVCGEHNMRRETKDDASLIFCVNHACRSNGGHNSSEVGTEVTLFINGFLRGSLKAHSIPRKGERFSYSELLSQSTTLIVDGVVTQVSHKRYGDQSQVWITVKKPFLSRLFNRS